MNEIGMRALRRLKTGLALMTLATLCCASPAQTLSGSGIEMERRLAELRARDPAMANRISMPDRQLTLFALLEDARDIDICDRSVVVKHFGEWLDERLALVELMTLSPAQSERSKELREQALGFSVYWQGVGSPRPRGSSCSVAFVFTDPSVAGAVTRKAYSVEAIKYLFNLCAKADAQLPHGQQPWVWRSCPTDERRNLMVFSFVDSALQGVYVSNETGLKRK